MLDSFLAVADMMDIDCHLIYCLWKSVSKVQYQLLMNIGDGISYKEPPAGKDSPWLPGGLE